MYKIEQLGTAVRKIVLGQCGENLANEIQIDVSSWLEKCPDANFSISVIRPDEALPYLAASTLNGNILTWTPDAGDTALPGVGKMEICAISGGRVFKTPVIVTQVYDCLYDGDPEDPPEAAQGWLAQLRDTQAYVEQAVDNVSLAEQNTQEYLDESRQISESFHGIEVTEETPVHPNTEMWVDPSKQKSIKLLEDTDVDSTLSVPGKAADAAATGEKIKQVQDSTNESFSQLKNDLTEFIDDHFEKPANYDYLTSKAPLDGVKGFGASGLLNDFSGLNVFVTRVEENTEYKLSRTDNSISALNVPYARILFSTSNSAKAVGDTIDGIVAYSAEANDKTFIVPEGAKYAYIGIAESRDVTNLSMQKITETHPSATYPIEKEKLINTEYEFDLNENIEYARFRGQVEQQVLNNPYPFVNASDNAINKKLRSIIKDIRLIGFDKADKYAVVIFRTRAGGATSFMMRMYPTDESGNSTGESFIHIDETVINIEQKLGIQQVTLNYGGGKRVCVSFDMEKYHSVSIFATTINYEIGGINPACYTVPDYGIKLSTSIPKDYPIVTIIDDDGSVGFTNTLQPVLDTYGFKATLAIVPSWIGASENYMTLDALKSVVSSGHDVIAHSLTHDKNIWYADGILTSNRSSRKSECEQSRDWFLDNGFGLVQAIAYPSGGYSTAQKRILEDDVKPYFDYGFTTEPGVMTDNPLHALMLKRTAMNKASYDLDYYKALIDECISSSGWLVLFCHSMSTSEVDGDFLTSIFAYLQETGVSVQRFSDAIKVKRNICSIGSWYREGSLYIGRDGTLKNAM